MKFAQMLWIRASSLASLIFVAATFCLFIAPNTQSQEIIPTNQPRARSQLIATNFPGSDIGAQINAAFASCPGGCSVFVPNGVYLYSTTIRIPIGALQGSGTLVCDSPSTMLRYTGSGDAVAALGFGENESGLTIRDCTFDGSLAQAGANGLHLRFFSSGTIENIRIYDFPGNGVLNEGVNSLTFISPDIESSYINVHNVGVLVNGVGASANANKIFGGVIGYAKKWGVFEDGSQADVAFPNGGNIYDGVVFEANGTNGQLSGNAYLQWCDGCVITNSYLEFFADDHIPQNVIIGGTSGDGIGDLDASPQGVKIVNNHFLSDNAANSLLLINGRLIIVENNIELGNPTNFVDMKSSVLWQYIGHNTALAATNWVVNNDPGPGSPGVEAGSGTSMNGPTALGYGFNDLTGDTTDLSIVDRPNGTDNLIGLDASGNVIYQIYNNGIAKFPGLIVDNSGLTFNTPSSRIQTVGGNNMVTGVVSVNGSTSGTAEFGGSYNLPPNCSLTPRQDMGSNLWWVSTSPTSVTAHTHAYFTGSFTYFCAGDAN